MTKKVSLIMIIAFAILLSGMSVGSAKTNDINDHWANERITKWIENKIVSGYTDNTFRPNNSITRAEFIAMVNKAIGYSESETTRYQDVSKKDWYYDQVAIARKIGYISGYPDNTFKPNDNITREEAASILGRILRKSESMPNSSSPFMDSRSISEWSNDHINYLLSKKYIAGYNDKTFRPRNPITRAETITILDRIFPHILLHGGIYNLGKVEGNVIIRNSDAKISKANISDDIIISQDIDDGDLFINDVDVEGSIIVDGGKLITIRESYVDTIIVNKHSTQISTPNTFVEHVVVSENTTLTNVNAKIIKIEKDNISLVIDGDVALLEITGNNVNIDVLEGTINHIVAKGKVNIESSENSKIKKIDMFANSTIIGYSDVINILESEIHLTLQKASIGRLNIEKDLESIIVNTDTNTSIKTIYIHSPAHIRGKADIDLVYIYSKDVKIDSEPEKYVIASGITAIINGKEVKSNKDPIEGSWNTKDKLSGYTLQMEISFDKKDFDAKYYTILENGIKLGDVIPVSRNFVHLYPILSETKDLRIEFYMKENGSEYVGYATFKSDGKLEITKIE